MIRRACERVDVNLNASVSCVPYLFEGEVVNVSEQGICIHTLMCFPTGTGCKLLIPGKKGMLELQALVKWLSKRDGFNDTMGFELLNPSTDYIEFVESLRQSL